MLKLSSRNQLWIGLALAVVMAATRVQIGAPFGHHLPDAAYAVFFLAGLYLGPGWVFPALLAEGFLIDVSAVTWWNVSGFCLSPAYFLLLPAYGAMWIAGRWYARRHRLAWLTLLPLSTSLLTAAVVAELFASGGFYLFSGRFAQINAAELGARLVQYLPSSLYSLALYVTAAAFIHLVVTLFTDRTRDHDLTTV